MHIRAIAHPNAYTLVPQPITQDMWHSATNLVSDSPCCDLPLTVKKKSEVRVLSRSCDITFRFMDFLYLRLFAFAQFSDLIYGLLDFFLPYGSPNFISDIANHCENRETAYSRSDIVVYPVFIAAAQLRNDSTIYHNLANLFMIFTHYHAVLFSRKKNA